MSTPLTLAETASVFGEQIVFGRLLEQAETPDSRLALLTETVDGAVATVFRQIAMNRFEHLVHTERREQGELAVERFGELWMESQSELLGDAVDLTDNYALVVVLHPPLHRLARLRLRVRLRAAARARRLRPLRGGGRRVRPRLPRAAGGRRLALPGGARARSSASTSPTRASGTSGWRSSTASSRPPRPRPATPGGSKPPRRPRRRRAPPRCRACACRTSPPGRGGRARGRRRGTARSCRPG